MNKLSVQEVRRERNAMKREYYQDIGYKPFLFFVIYGGRGVFFDRDTRLHTSDGKTFVIHPEFVNDFENDDYNNAYYNVTVDDGL